jgi:hypothetical protein
MRPLLPKFNDFQMKPGMDSQNTTVPKINSPRLDQSDIPEKSDDQPTVSAEPKPTLSASFIVDVNIPDGTVVAPKDTFIKVRTNKM